MKKCTILLAGSVMAGLCGVQAAHAQVDGRLGTRPPPSAVATATGTAAVSEDIEDIELRTQRELQAAEDEARFGTSGVPQGFRGSLSLTGVATEGNSETIDVGLGGRFTLGQGAINHSLGIALEYGEADGERDRNRYLAIYDLNYDFTPRIYAFGLARAQYDEFAPLNEQDVFLGVGPGYRIFNRPELAWRVQAGPGVRYTKSVDTGETNTDLAGILSSRFYYQLNESVFLTNDTDVLHSDVDTLISNEVALNSRIAGPISGRVGLRTDYSTDPAEGQESTDNRLSLGVVYTLR